MGDSNTASVLSGEILGTATLRRIEESKVDTGRFQYQLYSMILAFHFGEMEEAASFEKAMRKNLYAEASEPPGLSTRVFYTVLVYLALFRQSKRRKHKKKALSSYKILERWVSKGATNCAYMKSILDAEWWSITPKKGVEMVLEQYDRAVESATKMGHLHHEALACELAFNYLYKFPFIAKDKKIAYLKRSLACYEKWQGHAKVADLASRYKHFLEESKPIS
ncbi:protein kinase [Nitzschia inconspicua]|uniref:Protein kinase n=1 Tax=Nitzschia inconspicua TaxID=303405 RepID=A0A9K3PEB8_9STRA|nr:protein kinase [Nitzschia inconspicua]